MTLPQAIKLNSSWLGKKKNTRGEKPTLTASPGRIINLSPPQLFLFFPARMSASASVAAIPAHMASRVCLLLQSSGKRYGPQEGEDLSFDASDLPNPSQASRQGTGKSSKLQQDFFQQPGVATFFDDLLLTQVIELCTHTANMEATRKEQDDETHNDDDRDEQGRVIKVVGVSCEFGKHRSVALVERLANTLRSEYGLACTVVHHNIDTQVIQKRQQRERASHRDRKTAACNDDS
jgi:hypothetical protein